VVLSCYLGLGGVNECLGRGLRLWERDPCRLIGGKQRRRGGVPNGRPVVCSAAWQRVAADGLKEGPAIRKPQSLKQLIQLSRRCLPVRSGWQPAGIVAGVKLSPCDEVIHRAVGWKLVVLLKQAEEGCGGQAADAIPFSGSSTW
jgi:hypothetical protein